MKLAPRSQMWGKQNAWIEFEATSLVCLEITLGILLFLYQASKRYFPAIAVALYIKLIARN